LLRPAVLENPSNNVTFAPTPTEAPVLLPLQSGVFVLEPFQLTEPLTVGRNLPYEAVTPAWLDVRAFCADVTVKLFCKAALIACCNVNDLTDAVWAERMETIKRLRVRECNLFI
jgi:hypothetical protein